MVGLLVSGSSLDTGKLTVFQLLKVGRRDLSLPNLGFNLVSEQRKCAVLGSHGIRQKGEQRSRLYGLVSEPGITSTLATHGIAGRQQDIDQLVGCSSCTCMNQQSHVLIPKTSTHQ